MSHFVHLRYHRLCDVNEQNFLGICNLGGVTIRYDILPPNSIHWTFAICREDENFERRLGREVCHQRMQNGDYYISKGTRDDIPNLLHHIKNRIYQKISTSHYIKKNFDSLGFPTSANVFTFLY